MSESNGNRPKYGILFFTSLLAILSITLELGQTTIIILKVVFPLKHSIGKSQLSTHKGEGI